MKVPTEEDARVAADEISNERRKELEDIREVVKTAAGRRFYYRMIEYCRPFQESYVVGCFDATSNNEGRRIVGI